MPYILFIESSTENATVSLFHEGGAVANVEFRQGKNHAKLLAGMAEYVVKQSGLVMSDLAAVAVGKGPGSYTGLRVGTSTAKGLCFALDKPLIAIDSLLYFASHLQAFARQLDAYICPMIDARRMEVYTALYDSDLKLLQPTQAAIIDEHFLADTLQTHKVLFTGDGASKCQSLLRHENAIFPSLSLRDDAVLGKLLMDKWAAQDFEDLVAFEPFYLKDYVATVSAKKLVP